MDTKSFVQIEINAVFTTTSGKMQFRLGVFDHFKSQFCFCLLQWPFLKDFLERPVPDASFTQNAWFSFWTYSKHSETTL
jgi:hypothetical protein